MSRGGETEMNQSNHSLPVVMEKASTPVSGASVAVVQADDLRLRRLEALGFGIFNYSVLTQETCAGHYEQIRDRILDLKDEIQDAEDNLREEEEDVEEMEQELLEVEQSGNVNAVERLRDRLDEEIDEREEAEDVLEEARELYHRHLLIRNEIKKYCLELKVSL